MIVLKHCGQTYHADEKHIGYSIKCSVCGTVIPITRDAPDSALSSRQPPTVEHSPPEPKSPWVPAPPIKFRRSFGTNWLLPIFGILALAFGVTLTILSYRSRKNDTPSPQIAAATTPSPQVVASHGTNPTPTVPTKLASPSPSITKTAPLEQNPNDPLGIDRFLAENPQYKSTPTPNTVRYDTGTNLMRPLSASGRGVLHIMNGTKYDAIAKLVDSRTNLTVRIVYIQANSDNDIANISSGDYFLKFALGSGYNVDTRRFLYSESFMKFDEGFDFHEYRTSDGIEWTDYNITLHGVIGGNVHASRISASEFYDR